MLKVRGHSPLDSALSTLSPDSAGVGRRRGLYDSSECDQPMAAPSPTLGCLCPRPHCLPPASAESGPWGPSPPSVLTQGPEASMEKPVPKGLIQEGRRLPRPFPPALPAQACARDKPAHGQPTARAQASAGHTQRRRLEVLGLLGCLLSRPPRCLLCFQHLPRPERLTGWSVKVKVTGDKRTAGRAQTLCSGVTAGSTVCD